MGNIFTYGTLMFPQVWERVVSGKYESSGASVSGFSRRRVKGQVYPAVIHSPKKEILHGILYFDVGPDDLSNLDRFEGEYYFRESVDAVLEDGSSCPGDIYVLKNKYLSILSGDGWKPDRFSGAGLGKFLGTYENFT